MLHVGVARTARLNRLHELRRAVASFTAGRWAIGFNELAVIDFIAECRVHRFQISAKNAVAGQFEKPEGYFASAPTNRDIPIYVPLAVLRIILSVAGEAPLAGNV